MRCKGTTFSVNTKTFRRFFIKNRIFFFFLLLFHRLSVTLHPDTPYYIIMEQTKTLVNIITEAIQEKKGNGIVIADLTQIDGTICRYFVICQGNSPSQVDAITESVTDMAREKLHEKPAHIVGRENAQWVAMDYGDVLVHIFLPDVREYYDLEHLWEDAKLTRVPDLD